MLADADSEIYLFKQKYAAEVKTLNRKITDYEDDIKFFSSENSKLQNQISNLNTDKLLEKERLDNKIRDYEMSINTLSQELSLIRNKLIVAEGEIVTTQSKFKFQSDYVSNMENQLATISCKVKKDTEEYAVNLHDIESQCVNLKQQLSDSKLLIGDLELYKKNNDLEHRLEIQDWSAKYSYAIKQNDHLQKSLKHVEQEV
jgi:predicted  nucleic acid-binding Zn-ribbon protein